MFGEKQTFYVEKLTDPTEEVAVVRRLSSQHC
jgi:hypothetical protein